MRYDDSVQTVFYSPNGIKWVVLANSPYMQWLGAIIKGYKREEEYVGSR
jgi:predicted secreted acid phosphatase